MTTELSELYLEQAKKVLEVVAKHPEQWHLTSDKELGPALLSVTFEEDIYCFRTADTELRTPVRFIQYKYPRFSRWTGIGFELSEDSEGRYPKLWIERESNDHEAYSAYCHAEKVIEEMREAMRQADHVAKLDKIASDLAAPYGDAVGVTIDPSGKKVTIVPDGHPPLAIELKPEDGDWRDDFVRYVLVINGVEIPQPR